MPSDARDEVLPLAGGEASTIQGQNTNVPTQTDGTTTPTPATEAGGAVTDGVSTIPLPPAGAVAAPVQDAIEEEAETHKATTLATPFPDPLGAAPEGAAQTPSANESANGQAGYSMGGVTDGLANGRSDTLYARRRSITVRHYLLF
jgi:hypothetical protein